LRCVCPAELLQKSTGTQCAKAGALAVYVPGRAAAKLLGAREQLSGALWRVLLVSLVEH